MKRRMLIIAILLCLIVVIALPYINAYMIKQHVVENQFSKAVVDCVVEEVFDGKIKSQIKVKSTSNTDVYIRVSIGHHWLDSKGDSVGKLSELKIKNTKVTPNTTHTLDDTDDWLNDGWVLEDSIFYYKLPISPANTTPSLLKEGFVFELQTDKITETIFNQTVEYNYYQVVEVHAEAIQSLPDDAVESSWGVFINESTGELSLTDNGDD